ncbi:MAG: AgmX/PglI C-terminal domain-containing protein [Kofleriaceae bacterium]
MVKLLIAWSVLMIGSGCGGGTSSSTTTPSEDNSQPAAHDGSSEMVSPETQDEIRSRLDRKLGSVCRCLTQAVDNQELPKNSKGKTTMSIEILPGGKAGEVKVIKATIDSASLTQCMINHIREIEFPAVPKPYPTSYTYGCETN